MASITVGVEPESVRLQYQFRANGDDWRQVNTPVKLTRTPEHFGGERVWFACPGCEKRCATIYIHGKPACRTCKRLTYGCQVEKPYEQHLRQARKIENIIESRGGVVSHGDIDRKPPTMHWSTFMRLVDRHDYHTEQSLRAALATM